MSNLETSVREKLQNFLTMTFSSDMVTQMEDVKKASEWLESVNDKDKFLSNVSNTIITRIMESIELPYIGLMIDQIKINSSDNEPNILFNISFASESLKPYIEFVKVVNGVSTSSMLKTVFQFDSNFSLTDSKISFNNNKKTLTIGKLDLHFEASIIQIGTLGYKFNKPQIIGEKNFSLELPFHPLELN